MVFHSFKSRLLASLWIGALGVIAISPAHAQVSLSTVPTTQTFDSLGTTATATLPEGFKVDKNTSIATVGTYTAAGTATEQVDGVAVSSSAPNGIYNFGSGATNTGPDRAVGFLSSGSATKSGNLYVQLRNDTGVSVTQLPLSYNVEKYRNGSNAAGFRVQLYFSTDGGTSFASAGSGFLTSFAADANSNGATPAPLNSTAVSGTLSLPTALAPSSSVVLAWNYSVSSGTTTSSAQALAIDDFTFSGTDGGATTTPTPGVTPAATATPLPSAATSGALINEFRLSGPSGASDEFIELYNQTNRLLDLTGWSVAGGSVTVQIPANKVIPPYGRLLLTGSTYSLKDYGGTNAATGDVPYTGDITLGSTLTLRNALGDAVDVVSSSGLVSPTSTTSNYSYVRRMDGAGGAPQVGGAFNLADVNSTAGPDSTTGLSDNKLRIGAPGPQNLASPIVANQLIKFTQTSVARSAPGSNLLIVRATVQNLTTSTISALRFRTVGLTAGTSPTATTAADVRLISSTVSDASVQPLILEATPNQPNGGGLNATVKLGSGIAPGATATVEFAFTIVKGGTFRYLLNAEPITTAYSAPSLPDDDNMLLGNPSGAVAVDSASATATDKENLLVRHNAEAIGYQKSAGGPRWVSWHLDQSDIGNSKRSDNFIVDPSLPTDCRITDNDYSGSGYTRGHQCPSGDRTASDALNQEAFYLSNMLPQTASLNNGVWAKFEDQCRSLLNNDANELYIMSGGIGSLGTIAGGKVNVPARCWKVAIILPKGTNDISRITSSTRILSINVPNNASVTGNYTDYYTTVDAIEAATGLDLLSNLPDSVENALEAKPSS